MPAIYTRFMEKEARQWREIYKVRHFTVYYGHFFHLTYRYQALQLLEYLIKNGSERVVDDARSHVGTIKMLRNFHYIDDKGKDQGINGKLILYLPNNIKQTSYSNQICQFAIVQKRLLTFWVTWSVSG
jgi:hypothetical protein